MSTTTINLTLTVKLNNSEDYDPEVVLSVIKTLAMAGVNSDLEMDDSIKEEILDNMMQFDVEVNDEPSKAEAALLNLAKAVDNHDKAYGDTNWRNQACAQLEIAQREACKALGLDPWENLWYDENNRQVKVGE